MSSAPPPGDRDDDPAARRATHRPGRARLVVGLSALAVVIVVLLVWLILFQSADDVPEDNGSLGGRPAAELVLDPAR